MAAYKMYKKDELRKMSAKDLTKELAKASAELSKRTLHVRVGEDKQSHMVNGLRRYIARIKTITKQTANNEK